MEDGYAADSSARRGAADPKRYRALFLSDFHLGSKGCQAEGLLDFLRHHDAETIYLIARRRSFPLVTSMAYALGKLKVRHQVVSSAAGNDDDVLAMATARDAAFGVSFSPYAPESITQAQTLAQRGVPLVALTDSALSPLVAHAQVWFELMEADHAGFRSLSASLTFAMALTVSLAERRRQL